MGNMRETRNIGEGKLAERESERTRRGKDTDEGNDAGDFFSSYFFPRSERFIFFPHSPGFQTRSRARILIKDASFTGRVS